MNNLLKEGSKKSNGIKPIAKTSKPKIKPTSRSKEIRESKPKLHQLMGSKIEDISNISLKSGQNQLTLHLGNNKIVIKGTDFIIKVESNTEV